MGKSMKIERFEDIAVLQLARELTRKVNGKNLTLNAEPLNAYELSAMISLPLDRDLTV